MNNEELIGLLVEKGLIESTKIEVQPLGGGVSGDILLMDDGIHRFVVKRALPKLKVKEDWYADVSRNYFEQKYLKYVSRFLPGVVPEILYSDPEHHFFCMEMIEGDLHNWKDLLLNGQVDSENGRKAGQIMGAIHRISAGDKNVGKEFDTLDQFFELRIEPYLLHTSIKHPELAQFFIQEANRLSSEKSCLVHGDFSPKNILVGPHHFVLLDCEVAWYGDPVFDIAFLLNHFLLKALYIPEKAKYFSKLSFVTLDSYKQNAGEIYDEGFEAKLVHLLPLLMLARVDGKSPVEYLSSEQQQGVRDFVYRKLVKNTTFEGLVHDWLDEIQSGSY